MSRTPRKAVPLNINTSEHIGNYIRWLRETHRLSREKFAELISSAKGTVENWERGQRVPDQPTIARIIDTFVVDWYFADILYKLITPQFHPDPPSEWPAITPDQYAYLDNFKGPAAFHAQPYFDIPAVNAEWARLFPMLTPSPDSPEPLNLIEVMLTDESTGIIRDRIPRAHVMLAGLRIARPTADSKRFHEIIEACKRYPDFDRLWNTDALPEFTRAKEITVFDPARGAWVTYHERQTREHYPPGPYVAYTMFERRCDQQ